MKEQSVSPKPLFVWFSWLLASTIAASLAIILSALIWLAPGVDEDRFATYILVPIFATLLTLVQLVLLSRYFPSHGRWKWTSVAGWGISYAIIIPMEKFLFDLSVEGWGTLLLSPFIVGGSVGVIQSFVLRELCVKDEWWLLANIIGWGLLGVVLVFGNFSIVPPHIFLAAIPAIFTGVVLAFWTQHSRTGGDIFTGFA